MTGKEGRAGQLPWLGRGERERDREQERERVRKIDGGESSFPMVGGGKLGHNSMSVSR